MKKLLLSSAALLLGALGIASVSQAVLDNSTVRSSSKSDAWDFGAAQLDPETHVNHLTVEVINAWYPGVNPGTAGPVMPATFTAGPLKWVGGTNDRLRTSNTALTRFDANSAGTTTIDGLSMTGALYINATAATGRYFELDLNEDDHVALYLRSDAATGIKMHFQHESQSVQHDQFDVSNVGTRLNMVAKQAGKYRIFDSLGKPYYYRLVRTSATYSAVAGAVSASEGVTLPAGALLNFTNEAGKVWSAPIAAAVYSVNLPVGFAYSLSLDGATGVVITSGDLLNVSAPSTTHNLTVSDVQLNKLTGSIVGLGAELPKLALTFLPDPSANRVFEPVVSINVDAATYSVELEPNCSYTVVAEGVNDFALAESEVTITGDAVQVLNFEEKPRYTVTLNGEGVSAEQIAAMNFSFVNLNEAGYSYSFTGGNSITLRDGVYSVAATGLNDLPLEMALTSNLKVAGESVSKAINFKAVSDWSFADMAITNTTPSYKGMLFSGNIRNEQAKSHLLASAGSEVRIPVVAGEKVIVTFYYSANFTIDGGAAITTNTSTGSTSRTEQVEHLYTGVVPGFVTLNFAGTTYITHVQRVKVAEYRAELRVGAGEEFATINEALAVVAQMNRPAQERVSLLIEPGNYEEMLVINQPNISMVNTAAVPSIALENKGVDIAAGAVRVTSYYGHGYNYYSMHNQKWSADHLAVNRDNGYLSSTNVGAGSTNSSYWNATVVILANGFEADNIIFENSFNQYISTKESQDIVVEWEVGSKGARSTVVGSTEVQNRSFVERAAAVAIANNIDKTQFNNCRIIGRQDSFFGGVNSRVAYYKGAVMGAVDYIFGGMVAVFYQTELVHNTSETSSDIAYITAAQQSAGRGYLMYECRITSAKPGSETASATGSKPGYFGRPWQGVTSEVVFYNTTIEASEFAGQVGKSLIVPIAWASSLGGESQHCYEYGTLELSGENNTAQRASWSNLLTTPVLKDGTPITPFNFTKGTDNWDPIALLVTSTPAAPSSNLRIEGRQGEVLVSGVEARASVNIYTLSGSTLRNVQLEGDGLVAVPAGIYIVQATSQGAVARAKVVVR